MVKAMDYIDRVEGSFTTLDDIRDAISAALRKDGVPHSPAQYGQGNICMTCNKTPLGCPGVHTFEEIQWENNRWELKENFFFTEAQP